MSNLIVVLMGGLSGEREISFLTGKACSKALKKKGYKVIDLDAKGYFVEELRKLKPKIVFNALHGKYGEDGFVQSILESLKIPYTHSGVFASRSTTLYPFFFNASEQAFPVKKLIFLSPDRPPISTAIKLFITFLR